MTSNSACSDSSGKPLTSSDLPRCESGAAASLLSFPWTQAMPLARLVPGVHWVKNTRNGTQLTVRIVGPVDRELLGKFCSTLSDDVLSKRFNQVAVSANNLERMLTNPGGLTLMAMKGGSPVAIGEYYDTTVWGSRMRTCEVAVLVHQDHQRGGIGTLLGSETMRIAKARGYQRIDWLALKYNTPVIRMSKQFQAPLQTLAEDHGYYQARKSIWFSGLGKSVIDRIFGYLSASQCKNLIAADPMIGRLTSDAGVRQARKDAATVRKKILSKL